MKLKGLGDVRVCLQVAVGCKKRDRKAGELTYTANY